MTADDKKLYAFNDASAKLQVFKDELREFCDAEFTDDEVYYAVIYGSYGYGVATAQSDVDIMFVADNVDDARMGRCIDLVKGIHARHHLPLDTELRYEHKVLIPSAFMAEAISGAGFKDEDGSYCIPKIEKTRECLDSVELRQRFLLGLMAHNHVFVCGDDGRYKRTCEEAQANLVNAVIAARGVVDVPNQQALKDLLMYNGEDQGDFYLGFKDNPAHQAHLDKLCAKIWPRLTRDVHGPYAALDLTRAMPARGRPRGPRWHNR